MVSRRGFTLVEVIVACTLLSVAVLTLAASSGLALRLIGSAHREEHAARLAGTLLDSLVQVPWPGAGQVRDGDVHARWFTTAAGMVTVEVTCSAGGMRRVHSWTSRSLDRLQRLRPPPPPMP